MAFFLFFSFFSPPVAYFFLLGRVLVGTIDFFINPEG